MSERLVKRERHKGRERGKKEEMETGQREREEVWWVIEGGQSRGDLWISDWAIN